MLLNIKHTEIRADFCIFEYFPYICIMDTEFKIGDIVKAPNTIYREDLTLYVCYIEDDPILPLLYVSDNPNADKSECEKTFAEDTILVI